MGRPRKVDLGDLHFDTLIAFDLATDTALDKNREKWPAGLYLSLLDFQKYADNLGTHKTLGDLADLYLIWRQNTIAERRRRW